MSDIPADADNSDLGQAPIDKPHDWYGSIANMKEYGFKHIEDKIWFRQDVGYVQRIPICDDCGEPLTMGDLWVIREGTNEIKIKPGEYCDKCYHTYPHEKGTVEKPLEVVGDAVYLLDNGYTIVESHPKYFYRDDVGVVDYINPCIGCRTIIPEMDINDPLCKSCRRKLF